MALNSFRKHCSNVLSAAMGFVCNKNPCLKVRKCKAADLRNIGATFPEGIQGNIENLWGI